MTDLMPVDLTSTYIAAAFKDGTIDQVTEFTLNKDPSQVRSEIAAQRDSAKSFEELLGGNTTSGKNFVNRPFQIESLSWQPGKIEGEGLPFYAVIHAVTTDGEVQTITCGAKNVVNILAIADREHWFGIGEGYPFVKFVAVPLTDDNGKPNGRSALDLKHVPAHELPFK